MEDLGAQGIPAFLEHFLDQLADLGERIASDFLVTAGA
jgi:hypothetical protein